MDFKILITFGIGVAVYLAIIGIIALIKFLKNKKKLRQDLEVREREEKQNTNSGN